MNWAVVDMNVLLVDNHGFTLASLKGALEARGYHVVARASAREALEGLDSRLLSLAVLDFDLGPGPTGIDLAIRLRELIPSIGIVLLTSYRDPRLHSSGLPTLPPGTIYLCKADLNDLSALDQALRVVSHSPLTRRNSIFKPRGASAALTDAQVEVLIAVATGQSNSQIATSRHVSVSAVEHMIARIAERLGIDKDPNANLRVQLTRAYQRLRELDGS